MLIDRRRFLSTMLVVAAGGALASCGRSGPDPSTGTNDATGDSSSTLGSPDAPVTEATIVSPDSTFDVTTVHVPAGEPVVFTYDNRHTGVPHNLHVSGNGIDNKTPVRPGDIVQTLTVTFPGAGRYDYICDVHPETMQGVVVAA